MSDLSLQHLVCCVVSCGVLAPSWAKNESGDTPVYTCIMSFESSHSGFLSVKYLGGRAAGSDGPENDGRVGSGTNPKNDLIRFDLFVVESCDGCVLVFVLVAFVRDLFFFSVCSGLKLVPIEPHLYTRCDGLYCSDRTLSGVFFSV